MAESVIRTTNLSKTYGKSRGISQVNLEVPRGQVFGYLGPNGAGKTTTIRLLLNLIRPSAGYAEVLGMDAQRQTQAIHRRIGYLPGELALYEDMSGAEYVRYLAALRGGVAWQQVESLAQRLDCNLKAPIRTLSRGNKQKLGLVQALMHQPELLILDEPTSGLDPLMQQEFYRLLTEITAEGRTVFISSHNLPEVERTCQKVAIIREGELVAIEEVATLKTHAMRQFEVHLAQPLPAAALEGVAGVQNVVIEGNVLRCAVRGSVDGLIKVLANYQVDNLLSHESTLEEIFLAYYEEGRTHAV
jgi:ABC-2 type transport system ATP-binding protein